MSTHTHTVILWNTSSSVENMCILYSPLQIPCHYNGWGPEEERCYPWRYISLPLLHYTILVLSPPLLPTVCTRSYLSLFVQRMMRYGWLCAINTLLMSLSEWHLCHLCLSTCTQVMTSSLPPSSFPNHRVVSEQFQQFATKKKLKHAGDPDVKPPHITTQPPYICVCLFAKYSDFHQGPGPPHQASATIPKRTEWRKWTTYLVEL